MNKLAGKNILITGAEAARTINSAKAAGGRIVAVGTTVVRALETAAVDHAVRPGHGYTRLHIDKEHKLKVVDCLLTGLHEPQDSHLDLLNAFVDEEFLCVLSGGNRPRISLARIRRSKFDLVDSR